MVRHRLLAAADGWRLDVADELPGDFIGGIRRAMDAEKPGGYLLGEVWEDGSNKIAYSTICWGGDTRPDERTALLQWLGGRRGGGSEIRGEHPRRRAMGHSTTRPAS